MRHPKKRVQSENSELSNHPPAAAASCRRAKNGRSPTGDRFGWRIGCGPWLAWKYVLPAVLTVAVLATSPAASLGAVCDGPTADHLKGYKFVRGRATDVAIVKPLTKGRASPARGLQVMVDRNGGNCIACHEVTAIFAKLDANDPSSIRTYGSHGTVGPSLDGVARRYSISEMRAILVNAQAAFPDADTIMPSYYTVGNYVREIAECKNRAILSARDIEDVLAFLATLE